MRKTRVGASRFSLSRMSGWPSHCNFEIVHPSTNLCLTISDGNVCLGERSSLGGEYLWACSAQDSFLLHRDTGLALAVPQGQRSVLAANAGSVDAHAWEYDRQTQRIFYEKRTPSEDTDLCLSIDGIAIVGARCTIKCGKELDPERVWALIPDQVRTPGLSAARRAS
jgi:hypothetical protein